MSPKNRFPFEEIPFFIPMGSLFKPFRYITATAPVGPGFYKAEPSVKTATQASSTSSNTCFMFSSCAFLSFSKSFHVQFALFYLFKSILSFVYLKSLDTFSIDISPLTH